MFKVLLVYPNLQMINLMPSNISILSACLKEKGFDVRLFDTTLYKVEERSIDEIRVDYLQVRPFDLAKFGIKYKETDVYDDFRKCVEEYQPNLIAISIVEDTLPLAVNLLKRIRDLRILTIAGGVHVILNPSAILALPEIDMVCTGEGELAIPELCESISSGRGFSNIPNIDTKVKHMQMRPLVDLDTLPCNDFTIFERERFFRPMQGKVFRMIPIEIDRGCPYSCTFCAAPSLRELYRKTCDGKYYRVKSVKRIIEEIKHQVKTYGAEYIYFNSETFLAMGDDKFYEIADEYRRKIHLPFWCQSRIETVTEDRVDALERMGCDRISVGIEHGNEEFRREVLRKKFTNRQVIDAFEIFGIHSIPVTVNNMIGFPGETRELAFDTIRLNRKITADSINCFAFKPYHGTHLREVAMQEGYLDENTPVHSLIDSTLDMPQFSRADIVGLLRTFPLYIKFPERRFPEIEIAERDDVKYDELAKEYRKTYWGID